MTVHKLSAGDGYTYLTRQVASADEQRAPGQSLADYYVARGNPPGVWLGHGAAQLGLADTEVSEAQMIALFGEGRHPDRDAMLAAGRPLSATRLGSAYPNYADLAPYADRVDAAVQAFTEAHGREPSSRERNRITSREARRGRRAVAGFDLVFTPVKSASVLWGVGGPEVRAAVEDSHHSAVESAMAWVEEHAAYTRTGKRGIAQVDTTGLVCAAFDHRESRSGDPDLHTHVAVANKVCGGDGKWRSLDARGLFALGVAASERYNTRFEDEMSRRLGVTFEERPGGVNGKRPIREIAGLPIELARHFSRRRAAIEARYSELRSEYRGRHGREPNRSAQLRLAQRATLETREGKPPGRTMAEQVEDWTTQAEQVLGRRGVARMVRDCTGRSQQLTSPSDLDTGQLARDVVRTVAEQRSAWTIWNLYAETERQLRPLRFATLEDREKATQSVITAATGPEVSIRIAEPELIAEPDQLVRDSDGMSVYVAHGSERYTTSEILLAEEQLVDAAQSVDAPHLDEVVLETAVAVEQARAEITLDPGQHELVKAFACSPARIVVGIGAAGAGKTTAMRAFAAAWRHGGGRVVPLATSARAAQVLGSELDTRAENLHKFLHEYTRDYLSDDWFRLKAGDVVLLDEAGMAGTLQLKQLLDHATSAGATVRLLGDPAQLAAVDAGGALSLLDREAGATYLTDLHRFSDPDEGRATLGLRTGDTEALEFYRTHERIRAGSRDAMLEDAYDRWSADVRDGKTSVLIAATTDDVTALNARARLERAALGHVDVDGVTLHDGNQASAGDWVVTRANARTFRYHRERWVHNGDTWRVVRRHSDGSLTVRHRDNHGKLRLPADYVAESVELAYAATAHRVQGSTTDTAHALITPETTREALYVSSTRGRDATTWFVATETPIDVDGHAEPAAPSTADEVLTAVLARTGAEESATETIRGKQTSATAAPTLVERYLHAHQLAALNALPHALTQLPDDLQRRILSDPASAHLARAVADAVSRGVQAPDLLRRAHDLDDTDNVRSPAAVLASRIEDAPHVLGIPDRKDASQSGFPSPDVGHPAWRRYLRRRLELIEAASTTPDSAQRQHQEPATCPPGDSPPGRKTPGGGQTHPASSQAVRP